MNEKGKSVASVRKALDLLDILAFEDVEHNGMRLADLARLTGEKSTTLHAILKTMIKCGYVQQNSKQRYVIGKRCRQMGLVNQLKLSPQTAAVLDAYLKKLFDRSGLSVSFYLLENGERINYFNMPQSRPTKVDYSMLGEKSVYWYPSGRVLVAYCTETELARIIRKNGYPDKLWGDAGDRPALNEQIAALRADGWSKQISVQDDVISYSMPVFYPDGNLLGALGIYMSKDEATSVDEVKLKAQMSDCCTDITKALNNAKG